MPESRLPLTRGLLYDTASPFPLTREQQRLCDGTELSTDEPETETIPLRDLTHSGRRAERPTCSSAERSSRVQAAEQHSEVHLHFHGLVVSRPTFTGAMNGPSSDLRESYSTAMTRAASSSGGGTSAITQGIPERTGERYAVLGLQAVPLRFWPHIFALQSVQGDWTHARSMQRAEEPQEGTRETSVEEEHQPERDQGGFGAQASLMLSLLSLAGGMGTGGDLGFDSDETVSDRRPRGTSLDSEASIDSGEEGWDDQSGFEEDWDDDEIPGRMTWLESTPPHLLGWFNEGNMDTRRDPGIVEELNQPSLLAVAFGSAIAGGAVVASLIWAADSRQ